MHAAKHTHTHTHTHAKQAINLQKVEEVFFKRAHDCSNTWLFGPRWCPKFKLETLGCSDRGGVQRHGLGFRV
jgi:hypothetical protein